MRGRPFTKADDDVIRASKGRTSVDVATELQRAPSVIRLRAKRLGLGEWKDWSGGLKEFRGYKVRRIERGDGSLARRIPEHRAVLEDHLGRPLTDQERVHHINMRKRDNHLDNLFLCETSGAHSRAHHSINEIMAALLDRGDVYFCRSAGIYMLKQKTEGKHE